MRASPGRRTRRESICRENVAALRTETWHSGKIAAPFPEETHWPALLRTEYQEGLVSDGVMVEVRLSLYRICGKLEQFEHWLTRGPVCGGETCPYFAGFLPSTSFQHW